MPERSLSLAVAVLAAGASRRLGRPKQALRLAGQSLVRRSLSLAAGLDGVCSVRTSAHLVCGAWTPGDADVAGLDVVVHHNPDWEAGRRTSLALAADAAAGSDGLLILVCDQYRLDVAALTPLVQAFAARPERVVASAYGDTMGVPVLWPAALLPRLAEAGRPGREWLASLSPLSVPVPAAAFDVDRPEDLAALRRYERDEAARG